MKILPILFRGLLIGTKCVGIFYIIDIVSMVGPHELFLPLTLIAGIINGLLDGIIISVNNAIQYKIFSGLLGFMVTALLLFASLQLRLPDILADYFIYGEGGGGLEAGGWLAFNVSLLMYFGSSLFIGFPLGIKNRRTL